MRCGAVRCSLYVCCTVKVVNGFVTELGVHEVGTQPRDDVDAGRIVAEGLGPGGGEEGVRAGGNVITQTTQHTSE